MPIQSFKYIWFEENANLAARYLIKQACKKLGMANICKYSGREKQYFRQSALRAINEAHYKNIIQLYSECF